MNNQIDTASCIVLSRTDEMTDEEIHDVVAMLRSHNDSATIITTPWDQADGRPDAGGHRADPDPGRWSWPRCSTRRPITTTITMTTTMSTSTSTSIITTTITRIITRSAAAITIMTTTMMTTAAATILMTTTSMTMTRTAATIIITSMRDGHECDDPDCGCHHHHHHGHDADEVFTSWGRETTKKFTQDEIQKHPCRAG